MKKTKTHKTETLKLKDRLERNHRRAVGLKKSYHRWKKQALKTGKCPSCGETLNMKPGQTKPNADDVQKTIEEGLHECVWPFRDRENDLAAERERLEIELYEAQNEEELIPVGEIMDGLGILNIGESETR